MNIVVEIPQNLPDALHCTADEFSREAKMAMAAKLYEMGRMSSGMAAMLAGMGRVEFLMELHRFGVAMIDLGQEELEQDVANA